MPSLEDFEIETSESPLESLELESATVFSGYYPVDSIHNETHTIRIETDPLNTMFQGECHPLTEQLLLEQNHEKN